jgi:RNA polymerase sigma factor for flagellar operon FliA
MTAAAIAAPSTGANLTDRDGLITDHLPLVGHLVRELMHRLPTHVNRDDLVSAGTVALVLSARSFDPARGVPFARFAAIRIRGALTDELRTMDWASRSVRGKARQLDAARADLLQTLGRAPSRDELSTEMGVSVTELDHIEADVQRAAVVSLNNLTPDGGADLLPMRSDGPEGLLIRREQIGYLRDAIAELPERLRTVIVGHFFEQRRMTEIAAELGVTESRISQLRSEALGVLRNVLQSVDEPPAQPDARTTRRVAAAQAYCTAVANRSTLAGRLSSTTLLGEPVGSSAWALRATS